MSLLLKDQSKIATLHIVLSFMYFTDFRRLHELFSFSVPIYLIKYTLEKSDVQNISC